MTAAEGPWWINEDDRPGMEWNREIVHGDGTKRICFMANFGTRDAEGKACARLIAAAPEMAEVLEWIIEAFDENPTGLEMLYASNKAKAVLAKARGDTAGRAARCTNYKC